MKQFLPLFLIICLIGCSKNESVIEGKVPNASYDNEIVYLVPVKNPTKKTVDSTLIRDGSFRFNVKPKKQNQIYIIRVKPLLRLKLQEILVIPEPGTIQVDLDLRSSASGTPLNQTLQQWKERKEVLDSAYYALYREFRKEIDEMKKNQLQTQMDQTLNESRAYADSLAEKNKENVLGRFLQSLRANK